MRYRYQDPSKIPGWKRYGRIGLLLVAFHMAGYTLLKRVFGNEDGSSSLTEIDENIKAAHRKTLAKMYGDAKVKEIRIKGLTVVEKKETTLLNKAE